MECSLGLKAFAVVAIAAIVLFSGCTQTGGDAGNQTGNASAKTFEQSDFNAVIAPNASGGQQAGAGQAQSDTGQQQAGSGQQPGNASPPSQQPAAPEPELKAIPAQVESNCVGFVIGAPEEAALIAEIGGAWARPHPGPFAWGWIEKQKGTLDFSTADQWVAAAQQDNVTILATVWPFADWDQAACHAAECEVTQEDQFYPTTKMGFTEGIPKSRCAPCSMEDYKAFVAKLVERYDGDGIDDMPGLEIPIKYWEILNEPDLVADSLTFYKGTQQQYVDILKASREAILAACSDCKVVQGGAAGVRSDMLAYWATLLDLGAGDYFDIANIHYIKGDDLSTLNVQDFKALLQGKAVSKPVWVTEAQYNSESEVAASVDGAFAAGASKVFFTQFKVGSFGLPPGGQYSEVYDSIPLKCGS